MTTQAPLVRAFYLQRNEDITGTSGAGVVAYGVQFPDGSCVLRWDTKVKSTVFYGSIEDVISITGHGGRTVVVWLDSHTVDPPATTFKPGKYYKHTTGLLMHIVSVPVMTDAYGSTLIGEEDTGNLRPVSESPDAFQNWKEISREDYLAGLRVRANVHAAG